MQVDYSTCFLLSQIIIMRSNYAMRAVSNDQQATPVMTASSDGDPSRVRYQLTVNVRPNSGMDKTQASLRWEDSLIVVTTSPLVIMINGKQYDFGNPKVQKVLDESGHVTMKFNGSVMTEYGTNDKTVYQGGFAGNMETGFVRNGRGVDCDDQGCLKRISYYENGQFIRAIQEFNGRIMTEYNENGKKIYEGEYKGDTKNGFIRHGQGTEMDEDGNVIRSGVWIDGRSSKQIARSVDSLNANPGEIEELILDSNSHYNSSSLLFSAVCSSLKRIVMGDNCFVDAEVFSIDGLAELESIVVGSCCFTSAKVKTDVSFTKDANGDLMVKNCPRLLSISIGNFSFSAYRSFVLKELPSLQTLEMGGYCFYRAPKFSLIGLSYWNVLS